MPAALLWEFVNIWSYYAEIFLYITDINISIDVKPLKCMALYKLSARTYMYMSKIEVGLHNGCSPKVWYVYIKIQLLYIYNQFCCKHPNCLMFEESSHNEQ